ncbi:exonuclease domain-containing protein [Streptomyces sp. TG1A-8]|uniref:exonuclease domain-containing protein n=1 Tax=Streptomyces sp. TG1A-8 TaxID=3051385 RepID=UPI00265C5A23|nr:exonuclease domain-containing protein [Streptomyces sp. TG1A-8]MDO0923986.1 exonuclease domain-containing protein [Streptomyces sp. TG1A-8]
MDTETTGLTATSRIVEIAVTTVSGTVLLNPGEPTPAKATAIYHITDAMVQDAPTFSEILPRLTEALAGRRIVIYNRAYDTGRLLWELHLHHQALGTVAFTKHPGYGPQRHAAAQAWMDAQKWEECAMEQYAAFYGDWHDYFGSYTWQKLRGGHWALSDTRAVIRRLERWPPTPAPSTAWRSPPLRNNDGPPPGFVISCPIPLPLGGAHARTGPEGHAVTGGVVTQADQWGHWRPQYPAHHAGLVACLDSLAVVEQRRGQGVARALVAEAEKAAARTRPGSWARPSCTPRTSRS